MAVDALTGYAPDHPSPERTPSAPAPHQKWSSYKRVSAQTETLAASTILFQVIQDRGQIIGFPFYA